MTTYRVTWTCRDPRYQPICFRDFSHFAAASWYAGKIAAVGLAVAITTTAPAAAHGDHTGTACEQQDAKDCAPHGHGHP